MPYNEGRVVHDADSRDFHGGDIGPRLPAAQRS